jgi:hypothetical protein
MSDVIVYTVVTEPGGVDGMDYKDKGGDVVAIFSDKSSAERFKALDTRYKIVPEIFNRADTIKSTKRKLDIFELYALGLTTVKGTRY